jgi:hypothetical protein
VIKARSTEAPRRPGKASTHASGTPMSTTMIVETVAVITDSWRACSAPSLLSTAPASAQGARITSPTSGSTKNSKAAAAGTARSSGTRLCQDWSGLSKACLGEHRLALGGENVIHKCLGQSWILRVG